LNIHPSIGCERGTIVMYAWRVLSVGVAKFKLEDVLSAFRVAMVHQTVRRSKGSEFKDKLRQADISRICRGEVRASCYHEQLHRPVLT
jgi:hypothetical protein